MKITFLFGNGFDMRMGLESSYKAIESKYIAEPTQNENLQNFKKRIDPKSKYWSDFELAMGKHTEIFDDDAQEAYNERIRDFSNFLGNHLGNEEDKIDYGKYTDLIREEFMNFVANFFSELSNRNVREIQGIMRQKESISFHFVSFNYTHVLDKCLEIAFRGTNNIDTHEIYGIKYPHSVNQKVLHIHGELPGPLVMGVNDKEQIAKQSWVSSRRFCERYIKPSANHRLGTLVDDEVKTLIEQSTIICIFGMSLGETDTDWWKQLAKWLKAGNHRLIIFDRQEDYQDRRTVPGDVFEFEDNVRDHFLKVAKVDEASAEAISEQIFVIRNTTLLDFRLIAKKCDDEADAVASA